MENEQSLFCFFCIICFVCILGWISNTCEGGFLPVVIGAVIGAWVGIIIIEKSGFRDASVEVAITNAICMPTLPLVWDFFVVKEWFARKKAKKIAEAERLERQQIERMICSYEEELKLLENQINDRQVHLYLAELLGNCTDCTESLAEDLRFLQIRQLSMDSDKLRRRIGDLKSKL